MHTDKRKQLKGDYKRKPAVGAVYAISCGENAYRIVKSTTDIQGIQNRFQFAMAIKSCPDPALNSEWAQYGADAFSLTVLEELQMKEDQTARAFAEEIKLLHALWLEKLGLGERS